MVSATSLGDRITQACRGSEDSPESGQINTPVVFFEIFLHDGAPKRLYGTHAVDGSCKVGKDMTRNVVNFNRAIIRSV